MMSFIWLPLNDRVYISPAALCADGSLPSQGDSG